MARINIEDSLFKDSRFIDLMIRTGDQDKALGIIVRAFMTAQSHYLSLENDRLIPLGDWKKQRCDDLLIEVGLAEKREKGIYVSGSDQQFAWLLQRQNAGKSKKTPRKKKNETTENGSNRTKTGDSGSDRVETSYSTSYSDSTSYSNSTSNGNGGELKNQSPPKSNFDAKDLNQVLVILGKEKSDSWMDLYDGDQEWILRELKKAWQYYALDNPRKKPKSKRGWSMALSKWLERGWGYQAAKQKGQPADRHQARNENLAELWKLAEEGKL